MAYSSPANHARASGEFGASMTPYNLVRSRSVRVVRSTRHAMGAAKLVEQGTCWTGAGVLHVLQALANAFAGVCFGREVEKVLVGLGILHDGGGFAMTYVKH